jgi:hypothetical protein
MRKGLVNGKKKKAAEEEEEEEASSSSNKRCSSKKRQQPSSAASHSAERRDRIKAACTVSARMRQVVQQLLGCDAAQYQHAMQQTTIFAFKSQQSELVSCFLQDMCRHNSPLYQNKEALLRMIGEAYDRNRSLFGASTKSANVSSPE